MPVPIISRLRERDRGLIVQIVTFLPSSEAAVGRVEKNGAEKVFRPLDIFQICFFESFYSFRNAT